MGDAFHIVKHIAVSIRLYNHNNNVIIKTVGQKMFIMIKFLYNFIIILYKFFASKEFLI